MRQQRRCFFLVMAVMCCCIIIYFPILLSIRPEETETWNVTRDMGILVRPNNLTAIITGESICSSQTSVSSQQQQPSQLNSEDDNLFLLVVVCSSVNNFQAREVIRETWGNKQALHKPPRFYANETSNALITSRSSLASDSVPVKLVFMLGRSEDAKDQELIHQENSKYGDLVQEDFQDTYNNLTLKSVMMLKWVNGNCQNAKYIMKTDDDMFVNVPRLVHYLLRHGQSQLLLGKLICGAVPVKNKHSKWYAPRILYSERYYPNYLSGTGYVFANALTSPLYETALVTPFFHLEDVYVTGICAKQLKIKPVDHKGFSYLKRDKDPCLFHYGITAHHMTPEDMRSIWKAMGKEELNCDAKKIKVKNFRTGKCY